MLSTMMMMMMQGIWRALSLKAGSEDAGNGLYGPAGVGGQPTKSDITVANAARSAVVERETDFGFAFAKSVIVDAVKEDFKFAQNQKSLSTHASGDAVSNKAKLFLRAREYGSCSFG